MTTAKLIGLLLFIPFIGMAQVAKDSELFKTIAALDKQYFDAYNTCDLKTQANLYADDIKFYHDNGGLSTVKQDIINSIERNICNKVTRTLVTESLEVHAIKDFGAVAMGLHSFYNNQEPNANATPTKFIMIWRQVNDTKWEIAEVISLH
ncbi:nuclear transport factor 2 family protein [uncultured Dokdonia sp.]|uniref:nuclear transport factor 2 family protein n=1 Tax=uncultured Dokdonia sp. TaxID=575653 RepID=UPI00260BC867|nr:nuclear transport factor 2 family protein [uncultured Dokdonia sp.]